MIYAGTLYMCRATRRRIDDIQLHDLLQPLGTIPFPQPSAHIHLCLPSWLLQPLWGGLC